MFGFGKKEKDLQDRVEEYVDQHGVSTRQLNWALWYVRNHKKFFIILVSLLLAVGLFLWGYSAVKIISLAFSRNQARENLSGFTQSNVVASKINYADKLNYSLRKIIPLGFNKYDLVGEVTNDNLKTWLSFDYYFLINGQPSKKEQGFVFPQEKKKLIILGQKIKTSPQTSRLVLENLNWHKINPHNIQDWDNYRQEHLNFIINDKKFLAADNSGLSDKLKLSNLSFAITNMTAYSYLKVDLIIVLQSGSRIVGVNKYIIDHFNSQELKQINLSLVGDFSNVDKIDIIPEVNILDKEVFDKIK